MRTHGSVDEKLKEIGPQHIPIVIVIGGAILAGHHQTANAAVAKQRLIDCEVGQVGFDRGAFLRVQRLAGFESVESR